MGRFIISTFDGSPKCSARAWVEELDTYLQQHHFLENEAIKIVALHFGGKAYAWWIFESFSLKNAHTSTYAKFTRRLVERFDGKHSETSLMELNKPKQTKILQGLKGPINSTPLHKTVEEANIFHKNFLEARSLAHILGQEGIKIPFLKEDPLIEKVTPIHIEEEEKVGGKNVVISRAYLAPHEKVEGALSPTRGILVSL